MMQRLEYRTHDKSTWGPGPWQDEPDKMQWQDEETGLPCLIVRSGPGHLCGYVGVTEGHPCFGKEPGWGDPDDVEDGEPNADPRNASNDLRAHGGITFTGFCHEGHEEDGICHKVDPGEPERVWWLGFDCGHHMDRSPGCDAMWRARGKPHLVQRDSTYRDLAYVQAECADLARQLKAMAS